MESDPEQLIIEKPPRPRIISFLSFVFLLAGAAGVYRALWFAFHWEFILEISLPFRWWFGLNGSLLVTAVSWLTGLWLWVGYPRGITTFWASIFVYSGLYWCESWLFLPRNWPETGLLPPILTQIVILVIAYWVFRSRKVKKYFCRR